MIKYPQPVKFHKKVAQLQVDLKRPEQEEIDGKLRINSGCLFFTLAKALDDNSGRMDWDSKILMKIDLPDIANIITGCKSGEFPVNIFHKVQEDKQSTLKIEKGTNAGTYKLSMGKKVGDKNLFASIYLDKKDMFLIFNLMESSIPVIQGWTS